MTSSRQSERAPQLRRLFDEAVTLDPTAQAARLREVRNQDPALAEELEALLRADADVAAGRDSYRDIFQPYRGILPGTDGLGRDPLVGHTVAHFQLLDVLGAGGMGVVYRAYDVNLERVVALKCLPAHLSLDPEARQLLLKEARAAARLDHPGICPVFSIEEGEGGSLFISMAYIVGQSLHAKLASGALDVDEALSIATQIGDALEYAHRQGVVHRDIKPANVIIGEDGAVRLVDFGIAQVMGSDWTRSGRPLGTIAYMSPAQIRGERGDHRVDLWALGVVLYEMIAGKRPFEGDTEAAMLHAVLHNDPPELETTRSDVPAHVAHVVQTLLKKNPDERYASAAAVLEAMDSSEMILRPSPVQAGFRHDRKNRLRLLAILVGLLVVAAVVVFTTRRSSGPIDSVAVLPLVDLSGGPDHSYFSRGMTDELISRLGLIEPLRVISRTSVVRYEKSDRTLPEIARELKVASIVEGSVAVDSQDVQVRVRLIDGRTEDRLWEKHFHRELRNVLALQREIALEIAREIEVELAVRQSVASESVQEVDPEAYRLYLQGLQLRSTDTVENLRRAMELFDAAIRKDSTFAPAYAAMSVVATILEGFTTLVPDAGRVARSAADRAIALDPELSDAHMARGLVLGILDWDWEESRKAFETAIERNPGNSAARYELGWLLARTGYLNDALTVANRALEQDPLSPHVDYLLAWVHLRVGNAQAALDYATNILQLEPDFVNAHIILGYTYLTIGEYDRAVAEYELLVEKTNEDVHSLGYLGHGYAVAGRREAAEQVLAQLLEGWKDGEQAAFDIAQVNAGLGNADQAIDWLEIALEHREGSVSYLVLDPLYAQLRNEPRFEVLLQRVRLQHPMARPAP